MTRSQHQPTILDCTLRDGGYYNNWDFSPELARRYFQAVDQAGVDVVEVGFRFFPKEKFLGAFAYTTDAFLNTQDLPKRAKIAVMVNADELFKHAAGAVAAIDALFSPAERSPVALVRLACHVDEALEADAVVARLKALGYEVGLNLMQVGRFTPEQLQDKVAAIAAWGTVDVLYFADSLGNMDTDQARACVRALAASWSGPIGIHAHDNMGQGLANTLAAMEEGATWADATMLGMGRGAGNAQMEFLLCEMRDRGRDAYKPEAILSLVMDDFKALRDEYRWGTNLLYYTSARYGIHPTYVQTMYNDLNYDLPHVMGALEVLKDMEGHSFTQGGLVRAVAGAPSDGVGAWSAKGWLAGRDVLLLGAGPGAVRHAAALQDFIERTSPAVLSLNTHPPVANALVTAFLACHPTRILADMDEYSQLPQPLILPVTTLHELVRDKLPDINHKDFGLQVAAHAFEARDNGCTIPSLVVAAYGLALATSAGAKRIFLAGFDGFEASDPRQAEMVAVFEGYQDMDGAVPLLAITPTNFPMPQSSLYAPDL